MLKIIYFQRNFFRKQLNIFFPQQRFNFSQQNIKINHKINDSTGLKYLFRVFEDKNGEMNLINFSSFLRKYQQLEKKERDQRDKRRYQKLFIEDFIFLFKKTLEKKVLGLEDARAMANSIVSIEKLYKKKEIIENEQIKSLVESIIKQLLLTKDYMNSQELANSFYCLSKLGYLNESIQLLETITDQIKKEKMSLKSMVIVFHTFSKLNLENEQFLKETDLYLNQALKKQIIEFQDISDLIQCYSKFDNTFLAESPNLKQLEKLCLKYFDKMNQISLANVFNSLANFENQKFSDLFYQNMDFKIKEIIKQKKKTQELEKEKNFSEIENNSNELRIISNLFRGYCKFNHQNQDMINLVVEKIMNIDKKTHIDQESLITIFYYVVTKTENCESIDNKFIQVIQNQIEKWTAFTELDPKKFQVLIYTYYKLNKIEPKIKEKLKSYIELKHNSMNLQQISSVFYISSKIFINDQSFLPIQISLINNIIEQFQQFNINQILEISNSLKNTPSSDQKTILESLIFLQLSQSNVQNASPSEKQTLIIDNFQCNEDLQSINKNLL